MFYVFVVIMSISSCYAFFKTYHEYIPIISTGSSLVKVFKAVNCHPDNVFLKPHRYTSLSKKSPLRILVLLIPGFGNFLIGIYDFKKYGDNYLTLSTIHLNGLSLKYAPEDARNSKKIVRAAIKQNAKAFQFASNALKSNLRFIRELMEIDISLLNYASDHIRNDRNSILDLIKKHGVSVLYYVAKEVQSDEHFILSLIKDYPSVLKYCKKLRVNEEFIYSLIKINPAYFRYAHFSLRNDRVFVSKLMRENIQIFDVASNEIRSDVGFVEEQMKDLNPDVLKYSMLANDKSYISKRLKNDLSLFQHAGCQIRRDKDFISQFKNQNCKIIKYCSQDIRTDTPFMMKCIQDYELSLEWVDESLQNNPDVILKYVEKGLIDELKWMSDALKQNLKFAEQLAQVNGECLGFFHTPIRNTKSLIRLAVKTSIKPLKTIYMSLRQDGDFFLELIKINPAVILNAAENIQTDIFFALKAVQQTPEVMKFSRFRNNESFVLELVEEGFLDILLLASEELRNNKIFIKKLMEVNENSFEFASDALRKDQDFLYSCFIDNTPLARKADTILKLAIGSLLDDEVFLERVGHIGVWPLDIGSERLKKDKAFVQRILAITPSHFEFFSHDTLKNDKEFMLNIVSKYPDTLASLNSPLKYDKDILEAAADTIKRQDFIESFRDLI